MEFALVAPVVIFFIVGIIEVVTAMAVGTFLEGGLREASRFGVTTNSNGRQTRIAQIIADHSYGLVNQNNINLDTRVYGRFSQIGDEQYTDNNGNGQYDPGEPFVDRNGDGAWNADGGTPGLGDSNQIVVYRISYDWPWITGLMEPVMGPTLRLSSAIAVRNEPY